jgi:hypothetical protein
MITDYLNNIKRNVVGLRANDWDFSGFLVGQMQQIIFRIIEMEPCTQACKSLYDKVKERAKRECSK